MLEKKSKIQFAQKNWKSVKYIKIIEFTETYTCNKIINYKLF